MSLRGVYRLKKSYQFNYVYRKGKSIGNDLLVLHYAKNNTGRMKIGFCVSKKYGKATARNLFKRRMRFAFASILGETDKGYNYVLTPKVNAADKDYATLASSLTSLMRRAGLFCQKK